MAKNTQQPELSMVDQVRIRREKLAQLQQEGQNPFAQTKFEFTSNSAEIKKNFEQMEGKEVSVILRIELAVQQVFSKILREFCPPCAATVIVLHSGSYIFGPADAQHSLVIDIDTMVMTQIVIQSSVTFIRTF